MHIRLKPFLITAVLGVIISTGATLQWPPSAVNPDPNHAHADFAVWIDGKQLDFSDAKYMSGSSTDESSHPTEGMRKYLHLHDGNGHVIHRHKPGLTLGDFFGTLSEVSYSQIENFSRFRFTFAGQSNEVALFVNGQPHGEEGSRYVFQDGDQILITSSVFNSDGGDDDVRSQLDLLTDDACLYSKTCPWRGSPPTEGCIADPTVPCRE